MIKMHMPLLNEATDVWRAVEVTPLEGAIYRVEGPMPPDEEWEFVPGALVTCRWKTFSDGEQKLIPTGQASTRLGAVLTDYFKRVVGLIPTTLIMVAMIEWLPRAPEGHTQAVPLFLAGAGIILASVVAMRWLRPRSLAAKWTLGWVLGFGILFCLASPLLGT